MNDRLLERIRLCPSLPSLPAVAMRVLELSRKPNYNTNDVAKAISMDPALSSKILRTVNSSFYGCSHSISSITSAVVILGMDAVRTLALGFSLVAGLAKPRAKGFDHLTYWRRSLYAATAARLLAQRVNVTQPEECFLAALLMDIGMLAMDRALGEEYADVCAKAACHVDLPEAELKALDLTHAQVTRDLGERWRLPEVLLVPMSHHHDPTPVQDTHLRRLTEIVAVAARVADIFVDRSATMWSIADVRRTCAEKFGIGEIDCDSLMVEIGMRTREMGPMFEIRIDASVSYESILERANAELLAATRVTEKGEEHKATAPHDRRRAPRIRRDADVVILLCTDEGVGESTLVRLTDVSARGLGFARERPMPPGTPFIFRVPRGDAPPITLLYTVVRCVPSGAGRFAIGAELQCVMKDQAAA